MRVINQGRWNDVNSNEPLHEKNGFKAFVDSVGPD